MRISFEIKGRIAVLLIVFVAIAIASAVIVKNRLPPYAWAKSVAMDVIRSVKVAFGGKDSYIDKVLATQGNPGAAAAPSAPVIETSRLPIRQQFVALPGGFPAAGGGLTNVGDALLVMSRTGGFYAYRHGKLEPLDFGTLPNGLREYVEHSKVPLNSDAMRAHSVSYDPEGQNLFVAFTKYVSPSTNRFVVASLRVDAASLKKQGDWTTVYESSEVPAQYMSQAGGGRVLVDKGQLYFSVGYADDTGGGANASKLPGSQQVDLPFGKIFRKDLKSGHLKMLSLGHRNVQGITVAAGGEILATEHGPQGGDEINLIKESANYGWPFRTLGTEYGSYKFETNWKEPAGAVFEDPVYAFIPSIGISPIHAIKGFHEEWNGNILVGSLKAQSLFRVIFQQGRVVASEPIWIGHRIRDIASIPGEGIVLLVEDPYLVILSVDEALLKGDKKNAGYNFEPKLQRCLACHHFEQSTPSSMAPSLNHINGRKLGGDLFQRYSAAMKGGKGVWDEEKLAKFIADPQSVVPGTTMPNLGVSADDAADIAKLLVK